MIAVLLNFGAAALFADDANSTNTAAPPTGLRVVLSTLDGRDINGTLAALSADSVAVQTETEVVTVPISGVLELQASAAAPTGAAENRSEVSRIYLADGSVLDCRELTVVGRTVGVQTAGGDRFSLSRDVVDSIRLAGDESGVESAWAALRGGDHTTDQLVLRKPGNLLDRIEGVVGDVSKDTIRFLLDDSDVSVNRDRVFGIVYYRRTRATLPDPMAVLQTVDGQSLAVTSVSLDGGRLRLKLAAGAEMTVPLSAVQRLDFSLGKVAYLSRLDPLSVTFTPFLSGDTVSPELFKYRRDTNFDNQRLVLGDREYSRGLCVHSKTELRYRLGGQYRRFQAVAGIDATLANHHVGHVVLRVRVDGKDVFNEPIAGTAPPRAIDVDVSGGRELEIVVDFGENMSVCDHLILADARLVR